MYSLQAIIHIMRCPGDAIVSEWNRKHGTSSGKSKHTALASPQTFGGLHDNVTICFQPTCPVPSMKCLNNDILGWTSREHV